MKPFLQNSSLWPSALIPGSSLLVEIPVKIPLLIWCQGASLYFFLFPPDLQNMNILQPTYSSEFSTGWSISENHVFDMAASYNIIFFNILQIPKTLIFFNTLITMSFPLVEAPLKIIFWYDGKLQHHISFNILQITKTLIFF